MKILRIPLAIVLVAVAARAFTANAQTVSDTVLYTFDSSPIDAANIHDAELVQGIDGNFYGTTYVGGSTNANTLRGTGFGMVFRISPGGDFTNLYSFGSYPGDGEYPWAGLVQGSDSNFYGTTYFGGTSGLGTVFRISPSGTETVLYSFFSYLTDGRNPEAGLVQGSDGNLYGTTELGGANGEGTVFRISPGGDYTNLYSFGNTTDGHLPQAGLVQGSDSNFYGMTYQGGTSSNWSAGGGGTVFRISPSGTYTQLYSFGSYPKDGILPVGRLVQGSDSNFYGTTGVGGAGVSGGFGTVFRISPSGSYTSLYSFGSYEGDGILPQAGLVQGSDGNFYGTTQSGGPSVLNCAAGCGTVFRISPGGDYTNLYSFDGSPTDAGYPFTTLVQGSDSNFYGMTSLGGTNGEGTVFKLEVGSGGGTDSTNCLYSINPTNAVFDAAGGSDSVSVTASNRCAWTAASNDPSFITITSGSSGSGNATVHYTVAANTNSTEQVGTVTIAGQTFTVTQSGASAEVCTFTLSASSVSLPAKGGTKTVKVKVKGTDCAWTAVSNDDFITIIAGANNSGNGTVDYSVSGNTNTSARSGMITIAGQTFTVKQAAGGCTLSLSPKDGKFKPTGGLATVKVKANLGDCAWTATTTNDFITITAGASGIGNGTVSYTVAANTNTTALTGSITVGSQTFTLTESGAK